MLPYSTVNALAHKGVMMRIAVDVMGSDNHPRPDVEGCILAAREYGYQICLIGDEKQVRDEIARTGANESRLEIVPANDVISMADKPGVVGKSKPQSSMHIGMQLVKDGNADAFVTMGNTGAALTIATLYTLRRIPGIKRPALSGIYPISGKYVTMLDLGANADSKPEWLVQFALMGQIYAENALNLEKPRIALLSNGEEEGKGNALIREAGELLAKTSLNYIGNVEPKDVVRGATDVVISEGFVGNIFVKTFEASASFITGAIREEVSANPISMLGGLLMKPAFNRVRKRIDTSEIGGAPLLGVNGVVIVGHGRSNANAVKNAIHQAALAVDGQVISAIKTGLQRIS